MTHGGLFRLDPQRTTVQSYRPKSLNIVSDDPETPASNGVTTMFGDRAGNIWIGYIEGILSRFNPDTGTFRHYFPQPGNAQSIATGWIEAMYEDHDGLLWLASKQGLTRFDPNAETFRIYTHRDGLSNTYVRSVQEDRTGHLWLAPSTVSFDSTLVPKPFIITIWTMVSEAIVSGTPPGRLLMGACISGDLTE